MSKFTSRNKWAIAAVALIIALWVVGQFVPEDATMPSFEEYFK